MADGPIVLLQNLSRQAEGLAWANRRAEDRLQGVALAALARSPVADVRLLTGTRWQWLLEVVESTEGRFLAWGHQDSRSIVRIALHLGLDPVPIGAGPHRPPTASPVMLERPSMLIPSTSANLQRHVPDGGVTAADTVLLDLGRGDVLAVRRPENLLGWMLRARVWFRGRRLRSSAGLWPAPPFMELARQVAAWRADDGATAVVPLVSDPRDALMQVVAEIVRARQRIQLALFESAQQARSQASIWGSLHAEHVLSTLGADLSLRLDTTGDLADAEDSKTVTLKAHLGFEDGSPPGHVGRLRLDPPDFLASGDVLQRLLAALMDDTDRWGRWLRPGHFRDLLRAGAAEKSGTFALRVRRRVDDERWDIFLPGDGRLSHHRADRWFVLRADFKRGPQSAEASRPRLPEGVSGGRRVLHHSDAEDDQGEFDDDLVRAFLRLVAALHRYGQALF